MGVLLIFKLMKLTALFFCFAVLVAFAACNRELKPRHPTRFEGGYLFAKNDTPKFYFRFKNDTFFDCRIPAKQVYVDIISASNEDTAYLSFPWSTTDKPITSEVFSETRSTTLIPLAYSFLHIKYTLNA